MDNVWSVLITAITVLSGTSAFRYYEKRAIRKERDDEFILNLFVMIVKIVLLN